MIISEMLPLEPEFLEGMRKIDQLKPIMEFWDYLEGEQLKREGFISEGLCFKNNEKTLNSFTEEETMQLEYNREFTKKELSDESVLEKIEKTIYGENDVDTEILKVGTNEKVLQKSLYRNRKL
ncbi:MAG: hypothetical protein HFH47_00815 [Bacilli bacterium]|nr:hypothetical protein [Bacilli bacterium]